MYMYASVYALWMKDKELNWEHLVSAADLWLTLDTDDTSELHKAMMIKHVTYAKMVAIASKIIPLVNVNAIALVCNYLTYTWGNCVVSNL